MSDKPNSPEVYCQSSTLMIAKKMWWRWNELHGRFSWMKSVTSFREENFLTLNEDCSESCQMKKFLRIHRCLKHSESAEKVYSAIIRLFPRAFVNIRLLSFPLCLPWKLTMKKGFSTIRLQALRKVLISCEAQSLKYKRSHGKISSTT